MLWTDRIGERMRGIKGDGSATSGWFSGTTGEQRSHTLEIVE